MNHSVCLTSETEASHDLQRKTEALLHTLIAQRRKQGYQLPMSTWDSVCFCSEGEIGIPGWTVAHVQRKE